MLRIEDTDQERFQEGALDIIYRTLEHTGLIPDEDPEGRRTAVHTCRVSGMPGVSI